MQRGTPGAFARGMAGVADGGGGFALRGRPGLQRVPQMG
jgi:hypothetical protein